jgi:hypothetical protein
LIIRIGAYRLAVVGLVGCALALGPSAVVQGAGGPDVTQAPTISGSAMVGQTLTANGGHWTGPSGTSSSYQWLRCTDPSNLYSCSILDGATERSYRLVPDDQTRRMRVALVARKGNQSDYAVSDSVGPVVAASTPTPVKTPTPTPTPVRTATPPPAATPGPVATATPTPTPVPTFDVAAAPAATPVPDAGAVLHQTATSRRARMIEPLPVVRVRGRLTATGAKVTLLTVKAPRGVSIRVTCRGGSCPAARMVKTTKRRITELSTFERALKAGTRVTITVAKSGYASKVTVLQIRRGVAPLRSDGCLYPGHKQVQRCPR